MRFFNQSPTIHSGQAQVGKEKNNVGLFSKSFQRRNGIPSFIYPIAEGNQCCTCIFPNIIVIFDNEYFLIPTKSTDFGARCGLN